MEIIKPSKQDEFSNSQRSIGQLPRRKQYQSCDHCRKRRRACDAIGLGIDPFRLSNPAEENKSSHKACTTCQKSGIECTFEWLLYRPRQNLPQGIKRKLNAVHPISPETNVKSGYIPQQGSDIGLPWPTSPDYSDSISFHDDISIGFQQASHMALGQSEQHMARDSHIDSIERFAFDPDPILFAHNTQVFVEDDCDLKVPRFERPRLSSSILNPTLLSPNSTFPTVQMPMDSNNSSHVEEDPFSKALEIMVNLDSSTILPSSSRSPSHDYPPASPHITYDTSARGSFSSGCSFQIQRCSTHDSMEGSDVGSTAHDCQFTRERRKSVMIAELTQIYSQSMTNALETWTENKCACKRKVSMAEPRIHIVPHHTILCAPENKQSACRCGGFSC